MLACHIRRGWIEWWGSISRSGIGSSFCGCHATHAEHWKEFQMAERMHRDFWDLASHPTFDPSNIFNLCGVGIVLGQQNISLLNSISAMNSVEYQKYCLQRGIYPSLMFGSVFTLIEVAQGFRFTPTLVATNIGGLYLYNVLQCPMEAIHGRQSSLHNAASGAILGYVGIQSWRIGVPFVDAYFFYRYPQISPAMAGAVAYGTIGFLFASLGGKPM